MRIVFMGTRDIAVPALRVLLKSGRPNWHVVGVFTQPDRPVGRSGAAMPPPVKLLAQEAGIPVQRPVSLRDEAALAAVAALAPDVGVVASFAQLLPRAVLRLPAAGWLNIHPSLLPRYRGPSPVTSAILAGEPEAGVSIIKLVRAMDAGPIVDQIRVPIRPEDTTGTLTARLGELGAARLATILEDWVAGRITARPQDEQEATYSTMLTRDDGQLEWSRSAVALERQIRAYEPWPGTYTFWQGKRLGILAARAGAGAGREPGTVLGLEGQGDTAVALVATGDGTLALGRLQLEGRRVLPAAEFVRGQPGFLMSRLGQAPSGGAGTVRDGGAS